MKITKFKNGNVNISCSKLELEDIDEVYEEMTMSDLYITSYDDCYYIVDHNKQLVYDVFSPYCTNVLKDLQRMLSEGTLKLYPTLNVSYLVIIGEDE